VLRDVARSSTARGEPGRRPITGAALVTPNLPEAETLTGERGSGTRAARVLQARTRAVKGGHAEGPADDLLATRTGVTWLRGERVAGDPVHGTGCALSAAIAARLARGEALADAMRAAKALLARAIAAAQPLGKGARILRLDAASD
jgi:hydroxymethylpyrimidine/phosphomethylpyrimidine kinase